MRGGNAGIAIVSSKGKSQAFFDFGLPPRRQKTEDEIAIERILAEEQRANPEPEPPGRAAVREEMRRRIFEQQRQNRREMGLDSAPKIGAAAGARMASYVERKARR